MPRERADFGDGRQAIAPLIRAVAIEKSIIVRSIAIPLGTQGRRLSSKEPLPQTIGRRVMRQPAENSGLPHKQDRTVRAAGELVRGCDPTYAPVQSRVSLGDRVREGIRYAAIALAVSLSSTGTSAAPPPNAECAQLADPPTCLVERAAHASQKDKGLLQAVVLTGAMSVVEDHASALTHAVKGWVKDVSVASEYPEIQSRTRAIAEQVAAADFAVTPAALALAAASHSHDNPFELTITKKLIARAGNDPAIAPIAVELWRKLAALYDWSGHNHLTRPRGMSNLWREVIARPPADERVLVETAETASAHGYRTEGLALLRIAAARGGLSNEMKAAMALQLAKWHRLPDEAQRLLDSGGATAQDLDISEIRVAVARARLHRGYDAAAAKVVADACQQGPTPLFSIYAFTHWYMWEPELEALEAGKAINELLKLGDAYLARARKPNDNPGNQVRWFALASEAFRRGGDKIRAITAAREGLPFIPNAVARANDGLELTFTDPRAAAVAAFGRGTEPVVALYKAGARDEAIASGYLTGLARYLNAEHAGEAPDPQWVVDDRSPLHINILIGWLISTNDQPNAARLYGGLRCSDIYGTDSFYRERALGIAAAMSGWRQLMKAHFIASAADRDGADQRRTANIGLPPALALAVDWRRGLTLSERVAANDNQPPQSNCR